MAEADKDGRMAEIVSDLHTTLGMSLHETTRELLAEARHIYGFDLTDEERAEWIRAKTQRKGDDQ